MKPHVFNLIVLDESGSMSPYRRRTLSGCRETIQTIISAQDSAHDGPAQLLSIYCFNSRGDKPSRYLMKNDPVVSGLDLNLGEYDPNGGTPLFDAIGATLTDLRHSVDSCPGSVANVTIITDGEENCSTRYTAQQIAKMIDQLKEMGWSINFIGSNIDVRRYAESLHIDNALAFEQTDEGMREMFDRERRSRQAWMDRVAAPMCCYSADTGESEEEKIKKLQEKLRDASENYF